MQSYPQAPKTPHIRRIHGETVADDWFYLRDRENPTTIPYLEAENRYTEEQLAASKPLQDALYQEMVKTPEGKARAVAIYEKARPGYQAIARNTIDGIVGWTP